MFVPHLPVSCTFLGRQFPGNPWPLVVLPESWVEKRRRRLLLFDTTKVHPRCNLAKDLLPGIFLANIRWSKILRSGNNVRSICIYSYTNVFVIKHKYIYNHIIYYIHVYILFAAFLWHRNTNWQNYKHTTVLQLHDMWQNGSDSNDVQKDM